MSAEPDFNQFGVNDANHIARDTRWAERGGLKSHG